MSRVIASLVVAAVAAGCGGGHANTGPSAVDVAEHNYRAAHAKAAAAYVSCQTDLGSLVDRLSELTDRVRLGLNYAEYASKLEDVKVAYDEVPFKRLRSPRCVGQVGIPAETAFNEHIRASNLWGTCVRDIACSTASIRARLRRRWARAATLTHRARTNLEAMRQP